MYKTSLGSVTAEIEELLVEKMSAKGRDLNQKIQSAGRKLPRSFREQAAYLVEAEARYKNPKHAHQYDPSRVVEARKQCVAHLEKMDRSVAQSRRRLSWITSVAVNLFLVTILFIAAVAILV